MKETSMKTEEHNRKPKRQINVHYDKSCVVCGASVPGEHFGDVREHEYITTSMTFPVYRCPGCDLIYLYPRPDVSELFTIYPLDYYSNHMAMNAPVEISRKKSFVQELFFRIHTNNYRTRIAPYIRRMPKDRQLRVLDVGCGVGAQLDSLKYVLPECETYGVELGKVAAMKAKSRGHTVYLGRFEEIDLPEKYFDVIFSVHVIEHVSRPDLFLKKCLDILTDEGIVMIETPNTDCLDFDLFKKKHWGGYHPPRHWYLFQYSTFKKLAERFGCHIVAHRAYPMSNFWSWTCHSFLMDLIGRKFADVLFPPVKILYGGVRSFFILGFFAVLERILLKLTGRACSIWIVFRKNEGVEE